MTDPAAHREWERLHPDAPVEPWRGVDLGPSGDGLPAGLGAAPRPGTGLRLRAGLLEAAIRDRVGAWASREGELGTAFVLAAVWLGVGVLVYFALPREPLPGAFAVLAALAALVRWGAVSNAVGRAILFALAIGAAGTQLAQLHVLVRAPEVAGPVRTVAVAGTVLAVERRADGSARYRLRTDGHGDVRLTVRRHDGVLTGDRLSGRARLGAPPGPAHPGGYDFGFLPILEGVRASGFFLGAPKVLAKAQGGGVGSLRQTVSQIVRDASPGQAGAIAAALIVGDRSGIEPETAEALRRSGLAHILAISGLHMSLVTGLAFVGLRGLLALSPATVLRWPVRKWSAAAALGIAALYLMLSGASVSAQRAFIMVAVLMAAVLLDRRALTMRSVALAAIAVLLLAPHAVLGASFQMSFAAVAALVAVWQWNAARTLQRQDSERGVAGRVARYLLALALTSLVAGLATGLFAAFHFQRVAPLGLLGNLAAMPLVASWVMPSALLAALAMPFGLEGPFLTFMGWGTGWVVTIATTVSGWTGDGGETGRLATGTLLLGAAALVTMTALRTPLRWLSLPLLAAAPLPSLALSSPDVLISENGAQVAVRRDDALHPLRPRGDKFTVDIWRRAFAPGTAIDRSSRDPPADVWRCDDTGCVATLKGQTIVALRTTAELHRDCRQAHVLVIPFVLPGACSFVPDSERPLVLDAERLHLRGSHALRFTADGIAVRTAFPETPRPWHRRPVPDDAQL